jgi:hypothetical protein
MADVAECIEKLATAGQISPKIADKAPGLFSTQQGRILNNYAAPVKAESPRTGSCIYCRL